jgi:hypothetical protein
VKSAVPGLVTMSVAVTEWMSPPDAPVIEKLYVPAATVVPTVTATVAEEPAEVGLTFSAAQVAPAGNPGQVTATTPLNPLSAAIFIA